MQQTVKFRSMTNVFGRSNSPTKEKQMRHLLLRPWPYYLQQKQRVQSNDQKMLEFKLHCCR